LFQFATVASSSSFTVGPSTRLGLHVTAASRLGLRVTTAAERVDDSAEDRRLDAEMKSFVESWDPDFRDAFEEMGIFDGKEQFEDLPINSWEGAPLHHGEATAAFQDEEHQDGLSSSEGLDYLKISSAEFYLPGNYVKTARL
jgi:hypothetical protein